MYAVCKKKQIFTSQKMLQGGIIMVLIMILEMIYVYQEAINVKVFGLFFFYLLWVLSSFLFLNFRCFCWCAVWDAGYDEAYPCSYSGDKKYI